MPQGDERIHEIVDEVQQRVHLPIMTLATAVKTQSQNHNRRADFRLLKHVAAAPMGRLVEVRHGFAFVGGSEAELLC
jgi:hypothetical protein